MSVNLSLIGRKGRDYFRRRSWPIRQEWTGIFDKLSFEHAIDIGGDLTENFVKGTFDELYVVYNEFKSAIQQRVIVEKLFPIDAAAEFGTAPNGTEQAATGGSYLYEPDEAELLNALGAEALSNSDVPYFVGVGGRRAWRTDGGDGRRDPECGSADQRKSPCITTRPARRPSPKNSWISWVAQRP